MKDNVTAHATISIDASPSEVWNALTDPEIIKKYLFGTNVTTDWQEGSPITYTGEWEGKTYEDKGTILQVIPEKLLQSTYWSSMGGTEDKSENYSTVTYELEPDGESTTLSITQDNNLNEEAKEHSEKNWQMVLESIKKLLEEEKPLMV